MLNNTYRYSSLLKMSSWLNTRPVRRRVFKDVSQNNEMTSKVCLFIHFGLGDLICMISAIHYLSTIYSEVKILCLEKNINNFKDIFKNNDNITFLIHDIINIKGYSYDSNIPNIYLVDETKYKNELSGYTILRCGLHKYVYEIDNKIKISDIYNNKLPFDFYRHLNIPYSTFWNRFTIPTLYNDYLMVSLHDYMNANNIASYGFIHNITGESTIHIIDSNWIKKQYNFDSDIVLFINPNVNMYSPTSKFYEIANIFLNKPILDYTNIIRNATCVFLTNSSFFCLALHLDIKTNNKYVIARFNDNMEYIWDPKYGYNKDNTFNIIYDKNVGVIPKQNIKSDINQHISYISGGKVGDFIFQLGIIHANYIKTGKKGILYIADIGDKFVRGVETTYNDIKDIVLKQDYIDDFKIHNGEKYDINLSSWRDIVFQKNYNWIELFKKQFNVSFGLTKWVNINTDTTYTTDAKNKILISFSLQRENINIDINELLSKYDRSKLYFICLDMNEYISFRSKTNIDIPVIHCNIMELFIEINSCELFIGNFSAPFTVALSLYKKCIGISPTDSIHKIDVVLVKDLKKHWSHCKII